jgi:uncharacterized membrane protein YjjP (DUF1212 family)
MSTPASPPPATADYAARVGFVVELAEHLHAYGTTAQRLEGAVVAVAGELGLDCEPMVHPTGMVMSFSDPKRPVGLSDITRVVRAQQGDTNLAKLSEADRITEDVVAGRLGIADGHAALRALEQPPTRSADLVAVLVFGLAAASIATMWRLPWLDIATAGVAGLLIGLLDFASRGHPQVREAGEALAGMAAAGVAIAVAAFVAPLNLNTVIISALIVLVPGMSLTNAVNELASQHLVAGTARFAGAMATLMKLTVGGAVALGIAHLAGIEPQVRALRPQPELVEWAGVLAAAFSFALLFRTRLRDYPVVVLAALAGYTITRLGGQTWGGPAGIFLAALLLTAAGNVYARLAGRPGALVRVPGILMMVPGSASLRGVMTAIQQQDAAVGQLAALGVVNILLALIAGLLFGNLLLPPRRNL